MREEKRGACQGQREDVEGEGEEKEKGKRTGRTGGASEALAWSDRMHGRKQDHCCNHCGEVSVFFQTDQALLYQATRVASHGRCMGGSSVTCFQKAMGLALCPLPSAEALRVAFFCPGSRLAVGHQSKLHGAARGCRVSTPHDEWPSHCFTALQNLIVLGPSLHLLHLPPAHPYKCMLCLPVNHALQHYVPHVLCSVLGYEVKRS